VSSAKTRTSSLAVAGPVGWKKTAGQIRFAQVNDRQHDVVVGIAYYDDLLRPVADGRSDGFCKLIARFPQVWSYLGTED
jgi:hypothetical protein